MHLLLLVSFLLGYVRAAETFLVEMLPGCGLKEVWSFQRSAWVLPNAFMLDKGQTMMASKWIKRAFQLNRSQKHLFVRYKHSAVYSQSEEPRYQRRKRTRGKTIPLIPVGKHQDIWEDRPLLDPVKVFGWNDPLLPKQWHLYNKRNLGHDVNVVPVWKQGINGKGVVVCIIDDGVDYEHEDLREKFRKDLSFDFNDHEKVPLPDPQLEDRHGTRCAGQIVAQPNNGRCGVGVAWGAEVSAIRILSGKISTEDEAAAVVHRNDANMIYSCSWGPADDGQAIDGPAPLVLRAFVEGIQKGRGGKGSIYVFAAGNGKSVDDCNYDGYANGIYSLTVGAIDHLDEMPVYMEPCAAQLAVTYSSSADYKIATTDLGGNRCTTRHGGTSAAAPLAAGIIALVLETRPQLTWRDIQYLVVDTAVHFSPEDKSWRPTGAGRRFSLKYGYGKLDALRVVEAARTWKLVNSPIIIPLTTRKVNMRIPSGRRSGVSDVALINKNVWDATSMGKLKTLEHVTVTVFIRHPSRGNLQLYLQSPRGFTHQLVTRRPNDQSSEGLIGWTFMSTAFWGEPTILGPWTLTVVDSVGGEEAGELVEWRMTFWGESTKDQPMDSEKYAETFVANYFPPSPEYFDDVMGLWDRMQMEPIAQEEMAIAKPQSSSNKKRSIVLPFALEDAKKFYTEKWMRWTGLIVALILIAIFRKPLKYVFVRICCPENYSVLRQQ